jgi:hypothetical protein
MTNVMTVETEQRVEIRHLARDLVRLDQWAKEAVERDTSLKRWERVAELHTQRELVADRRYVLQREFWAWRYP